MIADFDTLAKMVDSRRPGTVKAWLARNRVNYFLDSKGKPVTTLDALNRALQRGDTDNEPNYSMPPRKPAGRKNK